jgi:hypothetical protein
VTLLLDVEQPATNQPTRVRPLRYVDCDAGCNDGYFDEHALECNWYDCNATCPVARPCQRCGGGGILVQDF